MTKKAMLTEIEYCLVFELYSKPGMTIAKVSEKTGIPKYMVGDILNKKLGSCTFYYEKVDPDIRKKVDLKKKKKKGTYTPPAPDIDLFLPVQNNKHRQIIFWALLGMYHTISHYRWSCYDHFTRLDRIISVTLLNIFLIEIEFKKCFYI